MKLSKIKEVLQKLELKKFFKYSILSILSIYFILNIYNLTETLYSYNNVKSTIFIGNYEERPHLEQLLADNKSFEDQYLLTYYENINTIKNDAIEHSKMQNEYDYKYHYESLTDPQNEKFRQRLRESSDSSDLMNYYSFNYPEAITSLYDYMYVIGIQVEILEHSIYIGLLIGLLTYMYSKSKKIIKLFIGYLMVIIILLIGNCFSFPSFEIRLLCNTFKSDYFYIEDFTMASIVLFAIILIIVKFIKNLITVRNLNSMIKTNSASKSEINTK